MIKSNISTYFHTDITFDFCRFHIWFWLPFVHASHFYDSLCECDCIQQRLILWMRTQQQGLKSQSDLLLSILWWHGRGGACGSGCYIHSMVVFVQRKATASDEEDGTFTHRIASQCRAKWRLRRSDWKRYEFGLDVPYLFVISVSKCVQRLKRTLFTCHLDALLPLNL